MRPYIGGSQTNDFLELTFGYNGFGRLTGQETGSVTGGGGTATGGMWGATGLLRLFGSDFATQISWLLPAALGMLVVGVVVTWRRPRVDAARATVLLLGGTLLVTGLAFSLGAGIIHPYYSVALAPAIGGLVGIGAAMLWAARGAWWARIVSAVIVLVEHRLGGRAALGGDDLPAVADAGRRRRGSARCGGARRRAPDRGAHADRDRRVAGRRARRSRGVRREHHADAAHRIAAYRGTRRVARLGDR